MTAYYAYPLADALRQEIHTVFANLDNPNAGPQYELYAKASNGVADNIIQVLLLGLVDALKDNGHGEGAGLLHSLAGVIKGTVHVLIRQMVGKSSNAELKEYARYLHDRTMVINGQEVFAFPLPEDLYQRFEQAFADIHAGNGEAHREALRHLMNDFVDIAISYYFDEFTSKFKLGFILRKANDIGRATLIKACHATMNNLFPKLSQHELKLFADYFQSKMMRGPVAGSPGDRQVA